MRALAIDLNRRTGNSSIRTEHTAIAGLGPKHSVAASTVVEKLAGVRWHLLGRHRAALGTGDRRT